MCYSAPALHCRNVQRRGIFGLIRTFGTLVILAVELVSSAAHAIASGGAVSETGTVSASIVDLRVRRDELTVDVRGALLAQVLRVIGERAGVDVTLRGDFGATVTEAFSGVPLVEGIRRLAPGASVAVVYGASLEDPGHEVVTAVWIVEGRPRNGGAWMTSTAVPSATPAAGQAGEARVSGESSIERPAPVQTGAGLTVDSRLGVRMQEIRALTEQAQGGEADALARLADISASESDATVRQQAVAAVARLRGADVERALTVALADDDVAIRVRAVRGLRGAGTDTSMRSLARVMTGDADPRVRLAALNALSSLPARGLLADLARASSDPDPVVREAAIRGFSWWNMHLPGAR